MEGQHKYFSGIEKIYLGHDFVFGANNKFTQEFVNDRGAVVKTLEGNWKTTKDKIELSYIHINFNIA